MIRFKKSILYISDMEGDNGRRYMVSFFNGEYSKLKFAIMVA